ncbi:hypothetical protein BX600DRAFT_510655 [Xylariales sp. PMI_506]|nr:hypothetical protein BX600DRAFT_510655 [Xylariales sp. PMI_506]
MPTGHTLRQVSNWKTRKLRWPFAFLVISFEIAMIAVVVFLEQKSTKENGILTVSSLGVDSADADTLISDMTKFGLSSAVSQDGAGLGYGLLWTTLPVIVMTLYRYAWDAIVDATAERQPYVELARDRSRAANARHTIMLDYRSYPVLYNWAVAFKNGHYLISFSKLLSLVLSTILVPLTAYLFIVMSIKMPSETTINITSVFNDQLVNAQTEFQTPMNIAASILGFGANPLSWSTPEYAFAGFTVDDLSLVGNITTNATAYSAYLDCEIKSLGSDYSIVPPNDGSITIEGSDRGCDMPSIPIGTSDNITLRAVTWSTIQCSAQTHYSRVGIITANYAESAPYNLGNLTVLSCIPSYWTTSGLLTASKGSGSAPEYAGFQPDASSATEFRPFFAAALENTLPTYMSFDPSNTFQTDAWGRLIYQLAVRRNAQDPLDSQNVKDSMSDLYQAFYAALASSMLFSAAASSAGGQQTAVGATLFQLLPRLVVVVPVAWAMLAFLFLILVCHSCLIYYAERRQSILQEEPVGLLGSAVLLQDSNIMDIVADVLHQRGRGCEVGKVIKSMNRPDVSKSYYDDTSQSIQVEDLKIV